MTIQQINQIASALSVDIQEENIKQLHGDASTRRYWRIDTKVGSWIISDQPPFSENDDFLNIAGYLSSHKIPIPKVIKAFPEDGIIILQDLGDALLYHHAKEAPSKSYDLYEGAVDTVVKLQISIPGDPSCVAYQRAFDEAKWLWELEHTEKYFFTHLLQTPLSPSDQALLRDGFKIISAKIQLSPMVFCHRDFHSRNLLLHQGKLFVIDFQDARLGPPLYDLVSLLRDCYVQLPKDIEQRLIRRYQQFVKWPNFDFEEQYLWTAIQRHLKACGTFAYQYIERGNRFYLPFIPPTWKMILEESTSLPELQVFSKLLHRLEFPKDLP